MASTDSESYLLATAKARKGLLASEKASGALPHGGHLSTG
jgi:hypothetical protein